jgi:hypothetical protein
MVKISLLLLAVGLAVGLWLGFNPQMHTRMVQNWEVAHSSFTSAGTNLTITGRSMISSPSVKSVHSFGNNGEWSRTSADFEELWLIIQKTWHDIIVNLPKIKVKG